MVSLHTHKYDIDISPAALAIMMQELAFFERAALEESTRRSLTSIERCYVQFCQSAGIRSFPVSFNSVGLYLVQYCHRFGHTTRTIPVILSHLKRANRPHSDQWLDAASQARLDDVIAGLKKYDHTPSNRKLPMTSTVLTAVQRVADMTCLQHYQHIVMSRVAREALLRGAELINLKIGDVIWAADASTATIVIHQSKANKTGSPEHVILTNHGESSAVAYLAQYFSLMGFSHKIHAAAHPLWPTINAMGQVSWKRALTKNAFVALARRLLAKAGYPARMYSGHSYRSGGATDLWNSHRCRPLTIKLHGRWKSDAYRLYIRDNPNSTAEEVATALAFFDAATRDF